MGRVFDDVYSNGLFSFILNQYNCFRPSLESYLTSAPNIFLFFFVLFNVPFKIISLIETSQSIGGAKLEYPGKTT